MTIKTNIKSHPKLVSLKIYVDFESILKVMKGSTQKNIKITFFVSLVVFHL